MYLFSRQGRISGGHTREALEWAVGITELANQITGLGVSLYSQVYSPAFGTMVWSCFVPDLATLEAGGDKLLADDAFVAADDKGASLTDGGYDDALFQVLYGEPDPNRPEYVTAVRAVCRNGKLARGLEIGVEAAQRAEKLTGTRGMFLMETTGDYGAVEWVQGHTDVKAMEAAQAALATDPSWLAYIDKEVADCYVEAPGATTQLIYRHMG